MQARLQDMSLRTVQVHLLTTTGTELMLGQQLLISVVLQCIIKMVTITTIVARVVVIQVVILYTIIASITIV